MTIFNKKIFLWVMLFSSFGSRGHYISMMTMTSGTIVSSEIKMVMNLLREFFSIIQIQAYFNKKETKYYQDPAKINWNQKYYSVNQNKYLSELEHNKLDNIAIFKQSKISKDGKDQYVENITLQTLYIKDTVAIDESQYTSLKNKILDLFTSIDLKIQELEQQKVTQEAQQTNNEALLQQFATDLKFDNLENGFIKPLVEILTVLIGSDFKPDSNNSLVLKGQLGEIKTEWDKLLALKDKENKNVFNGVKNLTDAFTKVTEIITQSDKLTDDLQKINTEIEKIQQLNGDKSNNINDVKTLVDQLNLAKKILEDDILKLEDDILKLNAKILTAAVVIASAATGAQTLQDIHIIIKAFQDNIGNKIIFDLLGKIVPAAECADNNTVATQEKGHVFGREKSTNQLFAVDFDNFLNEKGIDQQDSKLTTFIGRIETMIKIQLAKKENLTAIVGMDLSAIVNSDKANEETNNLTALTNIQDGYKTGDLQKVKEGFEALTFFKENGSKLMCFVKNDGTLVNDLATSPDESLLHVLFNKLKTSDKDKIFGIASLTGESFVQVIALGGDVSQSSNELKIQGLGTIVHNSSAQNIKEVAEAILKQAQEYIMNTSEIKYYDDKVGFGDTNVNTIFNNTEFTTLIDEKYVTQKASQEEIKKAVEEAEKQKNLDKTNALGTQQSLHDVEIKAKTDEIDKKNTEIQDKKTEIQRLKDAEKATVAYFVNKQQEKKTALLSLMKPLIDTSESNDKNTLTSTEKVLFQIAASDNKNKFLLILSNIGAWDTKKKENIIPLIEALLKIELFNNKKFQQWVIDTKNSFSAFDNVTHKNKEILTAMQTALKDDNYGEFAEELNKLKFFKEDGTVFIKADGDESSNIGEHAESLLSKLITEASLNNEIFGKNQLTAEQFVKIIKLHDSLVDADDNGNLAGLGTGLEVDNANTDHQKTKNVVDALLATMQNRFEDQIGTHYEKDQNFGTYEFAKKKWGSKKVKYETDFQPLIAKLQEAMDAYNRNSSKTIMSDDVTEKLKALATLYPTIIPENYIDKGDIAEIIDALKTLRNQLETPEFGEFVNTNKDHINKGLAASYLAAGSGKAIAIKDQLQLTSIKESDEKLTKDMESIEQQLINGAILGLLKQVISNIPASTTGQADQNNVFLQLDNASTGGGLQLLKSTLAKFTEGGKQTAEEFITAMEHVLKVQLLKSENFIKFIKAGKFEDITGNALIQLTALQVALLSQDETKLNKALEALTLFKAEGDVMNFLTKEGKLSVDVLSLGNDSLLTKLFKIAQIYPSGAATPQESPFACEDLTPEILLNVIFLKKDDINDTGEIEDTLPKLGKILALDSSNEKKSQNVATALLTKIQEYIMKLGTHYEEDKNIGKYTDANNKWEQNTYFNKENLASIQARKTPLLEPLMENSGIVEQTKIVSFVNTQLIIADDKEQLEKELIENTPLKGKYINKKEKAEVIKAVKEPSMLTQVAADADTVTAIIQTEEFATKFIPGKPEVDKLLENLNTTKTSKSEHLYLIKQEDLLKTAASTDVYLKEEDLQNGLNTALETRTTPPAGTTLPAGTATVAPPTTETGLLVIKKDKSGVEDALTKIKDADSKPLNKTHMLIDHTDQETLKKALNSLEEKDKPSGATKDYKAITESTYFSKAVASPSGIAQVKTILNGDHYVSEKKTSVVVDHTTQDNIKQGLNALHGLISGSTNPNIIPGLLDSNLFAEAVKTKEGEEKIENLLNKTIADAGDIVKTEEEALNKLAALDSGTEGQALLKPDKSSGKQTYLTEIINKKSTEINIKLREEKSHYQLYDQTTEKTHNIASQKVCNSGDDVVKDAPTAIAALIKKDGSGTELAKDEHIKKVVNATNMGAINTKLASETSNPVIVVKNTPEELMTQFLAVSSGNKNAAAILISNTIIADADLMKGFLEQKNVDKFNPAIQRHKLTGKIKLGKISPTAEDQASTLAGSLELTYSQEAMKKVFSDTVIDQIKTLNNLSDLDSHLQKKQLRLIDQSKMEDVVMDEVTKNPTIVEKIVQNQTQDIQKGLTKAGYGKILSPEDQFKANLANSDYMKEMFKPENKDAVQKAFEDAQQGTDTKDQIRFEVQMETAVTDERCGQYLNNQNSLNAINSHITNPKKQIQHIPEKETPYGTYGSIAGNVGLVGYVISKNKFAQEQFQKLKKLTENNNSNKGKENKQPQQTPKIKKENPKPAVKKTQVKVVSQKQKVVSFTKKSTEKSSTKPRFKLI